MGRIKTKWIKRLTMGIVEKYEPELSEDFESNKQLVRRVTDASSNKVANVIAGYVTRVTKMRKRKEL